MKKLSIDRQAYRDTDGELKRDLGEINKRHGDSQKKPSQRTPVRERGWSRGVMEERSDGGEERGRRGAMEERREERSYGGEEGGEERWGAGNEKTGKGKRKPTDW